MRVCNTGCVGCNAGVDFRFLSRYGCYLANCSSSRLEVVQFGTKRWRQWVSQHMLSLQKLKVRPD